MQYLAAFAILIASLRYRVFSLWRSAKQFQRLYLNQGGLHDQLYMALRWLDWIFLGGGYLSSLSIKYAAMSKDMDWVLLQSESLWQRNGAITFFYLSLCFSVPGVFFEEID